MTATFGYYVDSFGTTHGTQCVMEVAADQPERSNPRYTEFVGAFRCSGGPGAVTANYQAHLYDWPSGAHLASGPGYDGNTAHQGHSYGAYTRVHDQQSQQVKLRITLTLPATVVSSWSNLGPGCQGVNTRTATCELWSPPFQTVPLAGDCPDSGCPDRDGDGVKDNVDACPDTPGQPDYHGCQPPPEPPSLDPESDYQEDGPPDQEAAAPDDEEVTADQADPDHRRGYAVTCPIEDPYIEAVTPTYANDGLGTAAVNLTPEAALANFLALETIVPPLPAAVFVEAERSLDHAVYVARMESTVQAAVVVERAPFGWVGTYYEGCSRLPEQLGVI